MAWFDVYALTRTRWLVDVQAYTMSRSRSVLVPLVPRATVPRPIPTLQPILEVNGTEVVFMPHRMASAPTNRLPVPIANLAHFRDDIVRALDLLLTGF